MNVCEQEVIATGMEAGMVDQVAEWAKELQSLAQAGLFYGRDVFDRERYQRIREIATEMMASRTGIPADALAELFCSDSGYQTPKIDTRAVVFQEDRILLVRERDGRWSIPGGWCEFNLSPAENAVKEALEEAGLEVRAQRVIAIQDKDKHNPKPYAFHVTKIFFLCEAVGGAFRRNIETSGSGYFALEDLPPLAEEKCSREQVEMCFAAYRSAEDWQVPFD